MIKPLESHKIIFDRICKITNLKPYTYGPGGRNAKCAFRIEKDVCYWFTALSRDKRVVRFGAQIESAPAQIRDKLLHAFRKNGYEERDKQCSTKWTFCKEIQRIGENDVDRIELMRVYHETEKIFRENCR